MFSIFDVNTRHFFDFSYRRNVKRFNFAFGQKLPADFDRSEFNSSSSLTFFLFVLRTPPGYVINRIEIHYILSKGSARKFAKAKTEGSARDNILLTHTLWTFITRTDLPCNCRPRARHRRCRDDRCSLTATDRIGA